MILKTDNSLAKTARRKLQLLINVNNWAFEHVLEYDELADFDHAVLIKFGRVAPSITETLWHNRRDLASDGIWLQQSKTKGPTMQRAMESGCLWIPTIGLIHLSHIRKRIPWDDYKYILIRKEGNQFKFSFEETRTDLIEADNSNILQRLFSIEQRLFAVETYFRRLETGEEKLTDKLREMAKKCTENHT